MEAQIKIGQPFSVKTGLHYSWLLIALVLAFLIAGNFGAVVPNWERGLIWGTAIFTSAFFFASIATYKLITRLRDKRDGDVITQNYTVMKGSTNLQTVAPNSLAPTNGHYFMIAETSEVIKTRTMNEVGSKNQHIAGRSQGKGKR